MRRVSRPAQYVPIVIKEDSPRRSRLCRSHHDFFRKWSSIQAQRRLYPQNGVLAHVIGYTGESSEQEL